ncbi:carbohydrate ABC transporter permease [Devosia riboflavina]|uniref:carbohydrate ABC transporter permease n=1 Tax=Devosia riboflavina TaxID=46914 RepID=UPI00068FC2C2|nr:sugar ABC transporter permease [Devosia riboflavina]
MRRSGRTKFHIWLLLPAFTFYTVFWIVPAVVAFLSSFTQWNGVSLASIRWVGLANYVELFDDRWFWNALRNNLLFVAVVLCAIIVLGMTYALILNARPRGHSVFSTIFFIPIVLSSVVIGLLFTQMLSPTVGLVGPALSALGVPGVAEHQWLGSRDTALPMIMMVYVWQQLGFAILLLLAGLQTIPNDYIEAARVDGASAWNITRHITLPLMRPVLTVVIVLVTTNAFLLFDLVVVMTNGGPFHASEVLSVFMYSEAFLKGNPGYGTAIAMMLFVIVLCVSVIQLALSGRGQKAA